MAHKPGTARLYKSPSNSAPSRARNEPGRGAEKISYAGPDALAQSASVSFDWAVQFALLGQTFLSFTSAGRV